MNTIVRLSRTQFLPVILSPVILGTAVAWQTSHSINWLFFLLALIGAALLHLASNVINDVYDYTSGVDTITEQSFPRDFPGWKVIPRGVISLNTAKFYAYLFYLGGVVIGLYLFLATGPGWPVLILGILGVLFSYAYVAPPLRLDYRGLALGEAAIFASFGPIPTLGAYFIQVKSIDLVPALASIPLGLLTAAVLLNHDLIFHDVYKQGAKRSLAVVLGRPSTRRLVIALSAICYPFVILLVSARIFPISTLVTLLALAIFALMLRKYSKPNLEIPDYAEVTMISLIHSLFFGVLLAIGFILA